MENVEEMPFEHTHWCKEGEEEQILSYNKNDVEATYKFFLVTIGRTEYPLYKGKNKIELRQKLNEKFHLNCLNYPDVKIGESLILKLYSNKTHISEYNLKKGKKSPRDIIRLKDCIPYWANFKTKEFNEVKHKFEQTIIVNIKASFDYSIIFHNQKLYYGTGGLHSCIRPGIYEANDDWIIVDEDVGSLYPSLAIQLGLYPEHLGEDFYKIYNDDIVSVRLFEKSKPKKDRDMVIMEGYKLAANGIYGKSGEESSFLYDPLYTMKTTIAGQMFLSLWSEKLVEAVPDLIFIQHNTDGISYLCPRKSLDKIKQVREELTKLTGLFIENNFYTKFVVRDVNNYLAQYEDGSVKHKGCFEIDKEFHKDPSMRIVPIALSKYFLEGIPIEETIKNHKDIFDFCLRLKTNSKSTPYFRFIDNDKINRIKLNRTTRYYISTNGGILEKDFNRENPVGVNIGYSVTLFNKYIKKDIKDYKIDYNFYIRETNKIKNVIDNKQLSLW